MMTFIVGLVIGVIIGFVVGDTRARNIAAFAKAAVAPTATPVPAKVSSKKVTPSAKRGRPATGKKTARKR